jgi:SET domain-containing protein
MPTRATLAPTRRVHRRLTLRGSPIHGKGVFARESIPAGTRLIEYKGERVTQAEGDRRYPWVEGVPHHTFLFIVEEDVLVDGGSQGNWARWINHSCDPNSESVIEDGRIFIESIRDIEAGEEITYDYHLHLEGRHTPAVKRSYPCHCGTRKCRGTTLAKKR